MWVNLLYDIFLSFFDKKVSLRDIFGVFWAVPTQKTAQGRRKALCLFGLADEPTRYARPLGPALFNLGLL